MLGAQSAETSSLKPGRYGLQVELPLHGGASISVDIIPAVADPQGGHWIWDSVAKQLLHNDPGTMAEHVREAIGRKVGLADVVVLCKFWNKRKAVKCDDGQKRSPFTSNHLELLLAQMPGPLPTRLDEAFLQALGHLRRNLLQTPVPESWTGKPSEEYLRHDSKRCANTRSLLKRQEACLQKLLSSDSADPVAWSKVLGDAGWLADPPGAFLDDEEARVDYMSEKRRGMLVGLVLRSLRGWLQDYVGVDLENSAYQVEELSHNHLRFELQDVALTTAVWRFLVGPILPLTVESGRVDQVRVEVNADTLSVDISGASVSIRKLQPEEWCAEAEAYKARLLKEKRNWARGALAQTELRKWIKAKIRVTVSNAKAVLEESDFIQAKVAGYCDYIHVADPDHETWANVESASQRCQAPWDTAARDAQLQMAKDVLIRGVRAYFFSDSDADRLKADFGRNDLREEAALCPEILASAAYRAWDYGALHDEALSRRARAAARRVLAIQATARGEGDSESTLPRPLTITVNTASYTFLTGLLANMDSLYFLWSAALGEFTKAAGRKPTAQEAERYIELWRSSSTGGGFGSSYELGRLEDQFLWGFTQRLRRRAEEDLARTGVKSMRTGWCSDQGGTNEGRGLFCPAATEEPRDTRTNVAEHFMTECLEELSVTKAPRFEEQLHRSPIQEKMSPKIPEALIAQCLGGDMGGGTEPPEEETPEEAVTPAVDSREFALDSVYRIVLPKLEVRLALEQLPGERLGTMDISIPDLAVCYSSHLDCRYLSVFSSVVSVKEHPPEMRGEDRYSPDPEREPREGPREVESADHLARTEEPWFTISVGIKEILEELGCTVYNPNTDNQEMYKEEADSRWLLTFQENLDRIEGSKRGFVLQIQQGVVREKTYMQLSEEKMGKKWHIPRMGLYAFAITETRGGNTLAENYLATAVEKAREQWEQGVKDEVQMVSEWLEPIGGDRELSVNDEGDIQGRARCTFPDGDIYEGDYEDGKFHGKGTYTYADGTVYVGEFKNGDMNGKGMYTYADGGTHFCFVEQNKVKGRSVRLSTDKKKAWLLMDGKVEREVSAEARKLAKELGLLPLPCDEPDCEELPA
ncbi:RSPH1 [Symbiodinium sp. CCMP2592]|nr:RSPH1 [Symbiodinium sp. CCMP2592]